ncbi:MAG TPA: Fur family transcriptional regulator [Burkholderiales bacterium]|nr:Fur family transcriptional regulator [Burkholderiales bacterium]
MQTPFQSQAQARLRSIGARLTGPRLKVLAALLKSGRALTHQEILARLGALDRVTVYRVLEWLEKHEFVHKLADDDRVWRFVAGHDAEKEHAHFKCDRCGTLSCLKDSTPRNKLKLPPGYRPSRVDVTVRGVCARCARRAPPGRD